MGTVAIICIAAVIVIIVIILAVLLYHQMLLTNEINKRLLVMAREAIEKQQYSQEELNQALQEIDRLSNELQSVPSNEETPGDENVYHDPDLD